jgi:plastocyanin
MRTAMRLLAMSAGILASTMLFARGGQDATIRMHKEAFVPAKLEVAVGARITWTNADDIPHSVTALDGRFDSGPILPGKSFQWRPKEPGALDYHCVFHPSMTATFTVRAPANERVLTH